MEILSVAPYREISTYFCLFSGLGISIFGAYLVAIKAKKNLLKEGIVNLICVIASIVLLLVYTIFPTKRQIIVKFDTPAAYTIISTLPKNVQVHMLNEPNKFEFIIPAEDADMIMLYLKDLSD